MNIDLSDYLITEEEAQIFLGNGKPGKTDKKATCGIQAMEEALKISKPMKLLKLKPRILALIIIPLLIAILFSLFYKTIANAWGADFDKFAGLLGFLLLACMAYAAINLQVKNRMYYYKNIPRHLTLICEKLGIDYGSTRAEANEVRGGNTVWAGWGSTSAVATALVLTSASAVYHGLKNVDTNYKSERIALYISYNNVIGLFMQAFQSGER